MNDRNEKGEAKIEYCTAKKMLGDLFTKPLYGRLCHKFRDTIMGYKHITTLLTEKFQLRIVLETKNFKIS